MRCCSPLTALVQDLFLSYVRSRHSRRYMRLDLGVHSIKETWFTLQSRNRSHVTASGSRI